MSIRSFAALAAAAFFSTASFAQEGEPVENPLEINWSQELSGPENGWKCLVFGDKINVRAEPKAQAKAIAQLDIGSETKVLETDTAFHEANGWRARWAKIEFEKDGKRQTGWAWSGLLSPALLDDGHGARFVYGVIGAKKTKQKDPKTGETWDEEEQELEIRAVRGGKIVSSARFKARIGQGYYSQAAVFGAMGMKNCQNVLKVSVYYPACGYASYDFFCLWDGQKLLQMPVLTSAADAGAFYESEEYVFPSQTDKNMTEELLYRYELGEGMEVDGAFDGKVFVRKMVFDGKNWSKPKLPKN